MKTRIVSVLYFLSGIAFIILKYTPGYVPEFVIKTIIIPLLILLFLMNIRPDRVTTHRIIFAALLCSWAGDTVLELPHVLDRPQLNEILFMAGLLCFMATHVFYFTVFCLTPGKNYAVQKFIRFILPVLIYGALLLYLMYDDLGAMRIPVIIYTVVLLAMLAAAINRYKKVNNLSYYLVLAGAILFVLSDSLLAVNKFSHPFSASSPLIMSTYVAGQFLIVIGYMKQYQKEFV
jgi:uncharacterized membrane protein YhhN